MKKLLFAPLIIGVGCLGPFEPDVGEGGGDTCVNADSDPAVDVSFTNDIVPALFEVGTDGHCFLCHSPDAMPAIGIDIGGLDLSTFNGLTSGGVMGGADNVIAGDPCASILYQKVLPGPPFGVQMPFDGPPFLSDEDTQLLHDWIFEGAQDN